MNIKKLVNLCKKSAQLLLVIVLAFANLGSVKTSTVYAQGLSLLIRVIPGDGLVDGEGWTPGETITLTIDDPNNGPSIDYSTSEQITGNSFRLRIGDFYNIKPDDIVTVYGSITDITKVHVVNHVTITNMNLNSQTAFGTASPNVRVEVDNNPDCPEIAINVTSDENGDWEADFTGLCKINPGDQIGAKEFDDDNDYTQFVYSIFNPRIIVSLHRNAVIDRGWPENATLTLSIDDPTTGLGEDYTAQITAGHGETFPHAYLGFALYGAFQIQPGHIVTVSGGGYSVTHIVKDLRITNVDSENDIVSGKCTPDSEVRVTVHGLGQRTVLVDQAGNWSVDFSGPEEEFTYDITPSTEMPYHCYDKESNSGETESMYPARIVVSVYGDVKVHNWKVGQPIVLEIDDPATQQSPDFSTVSGPMIIGPWFYTGVQFPVSQAIDLQPGFLVTATQGTRIQTHTITGITIDEVNVDEDTVSGTAHPNAYVLVGVDSGDEGLHLVQADDEGNWIADYKVSGSFPPWQATADILEDTYVSASEFDNEGNHTVVSWHLANPTFGVRANTDQVEGWEWPLGATITVTVDDPGTPENPDITRTADVYEAPWNPAEYRFDLNLYGEMDIQPGFVVTASDGNVTKTHTVTSLAFTEIDIDTDTVTGIATASSQVDIWTCDNTNCYNSPSVIADGNGDWVADFTNIYDIVRGTWVDSSQSDEDGDQTMFGLNVPNPHLTDFPVDNAVEIWEWPDGSTLHLSVDDSATLQSPDFEQEQTIAVTTWGDPRTYARYEFSGEYDLKVGDVVTVTDGITSRTHVVQNLSVKAVNEEFDTITGEANPIEVVYVWPHGYGEYEVQPIADEGIWIADFTSVGFDLQPGMDGRSEVRDEFGNSTAVDWHTPNPRIRALPAVNEVHGYDWPMGASVQLTIDDDTDPNNGFLYEDTKTVDIMNWDWNHTEILFHLWEGDFTLQPGQYITMTDGNTIKTHWVTSLSVTTIDPNADTVSGIAAPGSSVGHWACDDNGCANRHVIAGASGDWIADFAHVDENDGEQDLLDIRAGVGGDVYQNDDDGDYTEVQWRVPNPTIGIRANDNHVEGWEWPLDVTVTITVDDPSTPETNPDITRFANVYEAPWNPGEFRFDLDLNGVIDIQPGFTVTTTYGDITKQLIVSDFRITDYDIDTDTVYGVAGSNQYVNIWTCWQNDPCISRDETADEDGNWITNFAVPGEQDWEQETADLRPGSWIDSSVSDDDGDQVMFGMNIKNPFLIAFPEYEAVEGWEWPDGSTVYLTIDDPATPQAIDFAQEGVMAVTTWGDTRTYIRFEFGGQYDLKVGDAVTITDGETPRTHIVLNLSLTTIDPTTDTITGYADPDANVVLWPHEFDQVATVYVTADPNGFWMANFTDLFDLVPGTGGRSEILDAEGNATAVDWNISFNQPPVADAGVDHIAFAGDTITLDASASSDPEAGPLTYEWDLDNDGEYDDATGLTTVTSFNQVGVHTIGLRVTDNGGLSDADTTTITVLPWTLKGFYQPVDMNGVYNLVKGGSTVPLKFEIFAGSTELTDIASIKSLTYAQTSCDASITTDEIETTATGGTSLRYAEGQFIYNWKTPSLAGNCYRVTMTTNDGSSLVAYFKLK